MTSGLTGAGVFNVYNAFGSVDVIVDIVGYYTDHNHDDRYYTEAETRTAATPRITTLSYNGQVAIPVTSSLAKLRDLGDFTSSGGLTVIDWTSGPYFADGSSLHCRYQIRVDGVASSVGDNADAAVSYVSAEALSTHSVFTTLSAGTHTIELWASGTASSCGDNAGGFSRQVVATEYGHTP